MAGAVTPPGEARPAWKVLRVLGNLFDLEGFDYQDSAEMLREARERIANVTPSTPGQSPIEAADARKDDGSIFRIGSVPMYATDPLVRRAPALQRTADGGFRGVRINSGLAGRLGGLAAKRPSCSRTARESLSRWWWMTAVPDGCAGLAAGIAETAGLGPSFGPMNIEKA